MKIEHQFTLSTLEGQALSVFTDPGADGELQRMARSGMAGKHRGMAAATSTRAQRRATERALRKAAKKLR